MQQGSIPPFPAEIISESPHFALMSALELGALMALSLAYWAAQARPLPPDDAALSVLAKCHTRRWYDVREKVLAAWADVQPRLASVYATKAQILTEKQAQAALARHALDARRKATTSTPLIEAQSDSLVPLVPQPRVIQRESRTNSGESIPKRTLRGQKHALLSDPGT